MRGVVGNVAPHLMKLEGEPKPPKIHDIFIDIGVSKRSDGSCYRSPQHRHQQLCGDAHHHHDHGEGEAQRGEFAGALERGADGERDIEVELALMHLRDEVAAKAGHDDEEEL